MSLFITTPVNAQDYPSKPIRIVLEFAAGAGGDVFMRLIAGQLSQIMGQPIVIENRAGAGGVVAAEAVIRSAPDGYTLLVATPNSIIVRQFLAKSTAVNLSRDLTPIVPLWDTPSLIMVSPNLPIRNLKELLEYAKANPSKLAYGTVGVGSYHHLNAEQIQMLTGVQLRHIPYKASAQANADLVGGEIPMVIGIAATALPFLKSGKIKVLASVEKKEVDFPDVPALGDAIPGFNPAPSWTALFAPAKVPDPILRRLNTEVNKALAAPEVKSRQFFDTMGGTVEQFQARIQRDTALVGKIVAVAKIEPTD
ncbi:MAG: Bug family tripartite tricarboxylate transporter substrate binding protein [Burkholderiales bacterium]